MKLRELVRAVGVAGRNAVLGANLRALGLVTQPRRLAHYASESLFLYKTITGARELPQMTVPALFPGQGPQQVTLAALDDDAWLLPVASYTADLVALCLLCRYLKPRRIFEIGTLNGYTAYHFALNAPDATVFTLDLPKSGDTAPALRLTAMDVLHVDGSRAAAAYCFDGSAEAGRIHCLFGDSATFDYSPYDGNIDLFFVDGAHSYEYVSSDTRNALRCCRPGGVIAWHDYGRVGVNGVSRCLGELRRSGYDVCSVPGSSLAFLRVPETGQPRPTGVLTTAAST